MTQENDSHNAENLYASTVFAEALTAQVNQQDVDCMIQAQKHMMLRFEKTNEMLINCNALSTVRFHNACQEFKRHTLLLMDMKKDLDIVFRKVRNLKTKLTFQYPHAFQAYHEAANKASDTDNVAIIPSSRSEPEMPQVSQGTSGIKMNTSSSCSQTTTPSPTSPSSSDSG